LPSGNSTTRRPRCQEAAARAKKPEQAMLEDQKTQVTSEQD
jgi:hypothetical protein